MRVNRPVWAVVFRAIAGLPRVAGLMHASISRSKADGTHKKNKPLNQAASISIQNRDSPRPHGSLTHTDIGVLLLGTEGIPLGVGSLLTIPTATTPTAAGPGCRPGGPAVDGTTFSDLPLARIQGKSSRH